MTGCGCGSGSGKKNIPTQVSSYNSYINQSQMYRPLSPRPSYQGEDIQQIHNRQMIKIQQEMEGGSFHGYDGYNNYNNYNRYNRYNGYNSYNNYNNYNNYNRYNGYNGSTAYQRKRSYY